MTSARTLEVIRDAVARLTQDAENCHMQVAHDVPDLWEVHELLRAILVAASEADAAIARILKLPEVQP